MSNQVCIGERIYFRPIEIADIDKGWYEWINDPETVEFLSGTSPVTKDDLKKYFYENQPPKSVMFAVCEIKTNTYFGNAKLGSIDWINRSCIYGRLIGLKGYRGQGFGSEVLKLLLEYAFNNLDLNRIHTGVLEENTASVKSNEKLGFRREGLLRDAIWRNGKYNNVVSFAMTKNDYKKIKFS